MAPGGAGVAFADAAAGADATRTTFGRMFPGLRPFADPSQGLTEALLDFGRLGGRLDAGDNLAAGPLALITDPALNLDNPNSAAHTAGTTFLGQFLDHDITFDVGSTLGVGSNPTRSRNGRTPNLDLDTVYGAGPVESSHLYEPSDRAKLRLESGGAFEDLPRAADMTAIISDPATTSTSSSPASRPRSTSSTTGPWTPCAARARATTATSPQPAS
jgi:hypothetical protein